MQRLPFVLCESVYKRPSEYKRLWGLSRSSQFSDFSVIFNFITFCHVYMCIFLFPLHTFFLSLFPLCLFLAENRENICPDQYTYKENTFFTNRAPLNYSESLFSGFPFFFFLSVETGIGHLAMEFTQAERRGKMLPPEASILLDDEKNGNAITNSSFILLTCWFIHRKLHQQFSANKVAGASQRPEVVLLLWVLEASGAPPGEAWEDHVILGIKPRSCVCKACT